MRAGRGKEECAVVATSAATHHARDFCPANRTHKYIYVCTVRQILVHIGVKRKAKVSARPVPLASCRWNRACAVLHFLPVAVSVYRIGATNARTHVAASRLCSKRRAEDAPLG